MNSSYKLIMKIISAVLQSIYFVIKTFFQDAKYITSLYNLENIVKHIFQDSKDITSLYNLENLLKTFFNARNLNKLKSPEHFLMQDI